MEGVIVNFRGSRRIRSGNHIIIKVSGVDKKAKAAKLVDKPVVWKTKSGKEITGKIAKAHGNSGAIRAIFERGLPGQAIGTKVKIS